MSDLQPNFHMFGKSPDMNLELRFTYMYENRYTHVTHQYLPKSLLEQNPKPNRKLVIFNNSSNFVSFLRFSGLIL